MLERRSEVVERMKDLDEKAAPIIQFLQDPAHVDQLHPSDKSYNVQLLRERFNVRLSIVYVFEPSSCFWWLKMLPYSPCLHPRLG
jgi:hypothetical protein